MESERHIEKILRAAAKKRREQAGEPFELDPVARQELLREASRRDVEKTAGGFFARFFSSFGPRLALAFSVVLIVLAGVWLARPLLSGKQEAATVSMANLKVDRPASQKAAASAPAPTSQGAAPTVAIAKPAPGARAETAAFAAATRRSSNEVAAKDKAVAENSASAAVSAAPSNESEANRQQTPAAELPGPVGAIQPSLAMRDSFKSTVPVPPPPPPSTAASTYQNTRAVNSVASADTADKVSSSTAPLNATNAIVPLMTVTAEDREAQKESNVAGTSGSVNTSQLANYDSIANNQNGKKLSPVSQRFNRVIAIPAMQQRGFGGGGGGVATPLLSSFRMEQNGREIRVVDADGSVYTGSWQVAPEQNSPPAAGRAGSLHFSSGAIPAASSVRPAPEPTLNNNLQMVQNYIFSVTGTNRNLKEKITFSGNFIPLNNASNTANNAGAVGGLFDGRNTAPLNTAVFLNSRIVGKVIIGDRREIKVNANPAP